MSHLRKGARALVVGLFATAAALAVTAPAVAQKTTPIRHGAITLEKLWLREPPKGARVAGGFLTISNAGATPDRLIGGSAPFAKRFEVHEMVMDGGMMKMRELAKGLEIGAGGSIALKPGGYHLMFLDLIEAPIPGKPQKVKLRFETAGDIEVEFVVEPMGGAPKSQHQH